MVQPARVERKLLTFFLTERGEWSSSFNESAEVVGAIAITNDHCERKGAELKSRLRVRQLEHRFPGLLQSILKAEKHEKSRSAR